MTNTSGNAFRVHDSLTSMPPTRKVRQARPFLCQIASSQLPGEAWRRILLQFRAGRVAPLRSRLEPTGWRMSRRCAATAAVLRRVVMLLVVSLHALRVRAANIA